MPEKTKQFVATDPDNLLKLLAQKQNMLSAMAEEVKELKKFYELKVKDPVILAYGKKNFYVIEREQKEPKHTHYRIKYVAEFRPEWIRKTKDEIKKGIDVKDLSRVDDETRENIKKWLAVQKTIKKLDNEGVAMGIVDEEEVLIGLIKSNITLLIRDMPFAKIMAKLFKSYYENTEELKI